MDTGWTVQCLISADPFHECHERVRRLVFASVPPTETLLILLEVATSTPTSATSCGPAPSPSLPTHPATLRRHLRLQLVDEAIFFSQLPEHALVLGFQVVAGEPAARDWRRVHARRAHAAAHPTGYQASHALVGIFRPSCRALLSAVWGSFVSCEGLFCQLRRALLSVV